MNVRRSLALVAGLLIIGSIFLPYWSVTLLAPQYPGGLTVVAYVDRLEGAVSEVDMLNHYIGMMPLGDAAQFERSISIWASSVMALLLVLAGFLPKRWAWLAAAPAIGFPLAFLLDLGAWLHYAGHNLDPLAPLTMKPFTPPLIGVGTVWQFQTVARLEWGFYLAAVASITAIVSLVAGRSGRLQERSMMGRRAVVGDGRRVKRSDALEAQG